MGETIEYPVNDTNRAIGQVIEDLKNFDSPLIDQRVKAIMLTHLQTAKLFSLELIKPEN